MPEIHQLQNVVLDFPILALYNEMGASFDYFLPAQAVKA